MLLNDHLLKCVGEGRRMLQGRLLAWLSVVFAILSRFFPCDLRRLGPSCEGRGREKLEVGSIPNVDPVVFLT